MIAIIFIIFFSKIDTNLQLEELWGLWQKAIPYEQDHKIILVTPSSL